MLRQSIVGAIVATALTASIAAAANPYPYPRVHFVFDASLDPDCASLRLSWSWDAVPDEAKLVYGVDDSDGNSQGLFEADTFGSGAASDLISMAPDATTHRFKITAFVETSGGAILLFGTNRFRMACNL